MGRGDTFKFAAYTSDDGTQYAIKISAEVGFQGGFSTSADPRSMKVWPFHAKNMRHVLGSNGAGKRTKLPCATPAVSVYVNGGAFSLGGVNYTVEGAIGEKRKLNSIS